MAIQEIKCLFSYRFGADAHSIGRRIRSLLRSFGINLEIDPFPAGVDSNTRMQALDVESVIFLCSPESISSKSVQMELQAAERQEIPIFTIHWSGEVPAHLQKRSYWPLPPIDSPEFHRGVEDLARAIQARVDLHRKIRILSPDNFFQETVEAAKAIATEVDRTLLAEYVCKLAARYPKLSDPSTRFWMALAIGKANTPQAEKLLDQLPMPDHPLVREGIRQAKAMLRNEPPA